ncbi:MAG TPA: hypothetical protein VG076_11845 [Acidimicrobiales bacterium]|nr:hypothetical protein [Acidimicrobiales bacterium]
MICPTCGARNPEGSQWCEVCLHRFGPLRPPTPKLPESKTAFVRTASTTLTRLAARGPLVFVEPGGDVQATVLSQRLGKGEGESLGDALLAHDSLRHLDERHTAIDTDDVPVFYVERYRAASKPAFAVFDAAGTPLAVYLSDDGVVIRDGTGAPVGRLVPWKDRFQFLETGGEVLAQCWREPVYVQWLVDDQWGLTVLTEPKVFDRRALVALPLVCRLLWSAGLPRQRTDAEMLR